MYLEPDTLFDNRYRLIELLGQGASAEVWLADDTLTGNLRVAIKIFSLTGDMDTYGAQDFQKEFARVYNINHQNLLTPTNYSVSNNVPYLVLPYCENGSTSSMVGRCEESDVIKLLHDVASGLAFLHTHKVLHQDIKPDNIMLDDDLNYLLTDFGISTGREDTGDTYGGTRAYMSPERFAGHSDEKGDVWALGATAYEMLTGNPPFGDHGGLLQSQGEPIAPITNVPLQPEMRKLLRSMLDPDPAKRPTPQEVADITGRYLQTGSWKAKIPVSPVKIVAIVIAALALIGGIWLWNHTRVKTYYYRDYTEVNGAPVGIGRLTGSDHRHRMQSYRFEVKGGKVRRVSLVNAKGKIVNFTDNEHANVRFPDQLYVYRDNGQVDYMIVKNEYGKVMYKLQYDDKMNTGSFYYDDDKHTHKFFSIGSNQSVNDADNIFDNKSNIHTLMLTRDDKGRWKEMRYHSLSNTPLPDINGVYGQRFEYDDEGRLASVTSIDASGNPVSNHNGMSTRRYKYDDDDNLVEISYFAADGKSPSHDGHNIHLCKIEVDKYGNRLRETYYNGKGKPVSSNENGLSGVEYEYNDNGYLTRLTGLDSKGKPAFNIYGYVSAVFEPDENNFDAKTTFVDADGKPIMASLDAGVFAGLVAENNELGLPLKATFVDEEGKPYEGKEGYATIVNTYTPVGDRETVSYYNADNKPVALNGFEYSAKNSYDELGRLIVIESYDSKGALTADENDVARYTFEYNPYGAVTRVERFDAAGKHVNMPNGTSTDVYLYDNMKGYVTEIQHLNADGKLAEADGWARMVIGYDPATSRRNEEQYFNAADKHTSTSYNTIDPKTGFTSTEWTVDATGKLRPGEYKSNYEFDDRGNLTKFWATDLQGNRINGVVVGEEAQKGVCEVRTVFDDNGNLIDATYYSADNRPATMNDGTHHRVNQYDERGRRTHEHAYDAAGKPNTAKGAIAEAACKYDNRGNMLEQTGLDGYGHPADNLNGVHRVVYEYDRRNNNTLVAYYTKDGKLAVPTGTEFARVTAEYDSHNNILNYCYYNTSDKLVYKLVNEYNNKHNLTKQYMLDSAGKPYSLNGLSIVKIEYAADGRTPKTRKFYDGANSLIINQTWNASANDWGDAQQSGAASSGETVDAGWMQQVQMLADECPTEITDGQILRSVQYTPGSVNIVIKWQNVTNDYNRDETADYCSTFADVLRENCNVPRNVPIRVSILNANNSTIFSQSF